MKPSLLWRVTYIVVSFLVADTYRRGAEIGHTNLVYSVWETLVALAIWQVVYWGFVYNHREITR